MRVLRTTAVALMLGLAAAAHAHAQSTAIGFKLGLSSAKLNFEDSDQDLDPLTKFTGGGFIRFGLGRVGIQPELMYVTKGAKVEDSGAKVELKLDYVEIPVLLHVPLTTGTGVSPYLYAGPAFSFEVGCTVDVEAGGFSASGDCDEFEDDEEAPIEEERKKFDVGAVLGGGVALPVGPGSLLLEARYNFGLINLNDSSTDDTKVTNRAASFLVGYSIPIGRR